MEIKVRYANKGDFNWLVENDKDISREWIKRCLDFKEYIVAVSEGTLSGFLRYSMFWGKIPYMNLIKVLESYRHKGIGTAMFRFWESDMKAQGAKILMTSAMENEPEPQSWHKRNGFLESGKINFDPLETIPEIFFIKNLVSL